MSSEIDPPYLLHNRIYYKMRRFLVVLGVISNTLTLAALISGKFYKNWTYVMLMNLSTTDLLLCLNYVSLYLPGVLLNR